MHKRFTSSTSSRLAILNIIRKRSRFHPSRSTRIDIRLVRVLSVRVCMLRFSVGRLQHVLRCCARPKRPPSSCRTASSGPSSRPRSRSTRRWFASATSVTSSSFCWRRTERDERGASQRKCYLERVDCCVQIVPPLRARVGRKDEEADGHGGRQEDCGVRSLASRPRRP
jgi:hypothetical protein